MELNTRNQVMVKRIKKLAWEKYKKKIKIQDILDRAFEIYMKKEWKWDLRTWSIPKIDENEEKIEIDLIFWNNYFDTI